MTGRDQREGVAAAFLRGGLAGGALRVPKLEAMARAAGLQAASPVSNHIVEPAPIGR
jgi:hypothetical protein